MIKNKIYSLWIFFRYIIFQKLFPVWQAMGFHITPVHYYQPIPDTRTLKPKLWKKHSKLTGINMNFKNQLNLLTKLSHNFNKEYTQIPQNKTDNPTEYCINNGGFESVDAEMLYSMIRYFKPSNFFEIGSGNSSLLAAKAIQANEKDGHKTKYTVIDPFLGKILKKIPQISKTIKKRVEDVPVAEFEKLNKNDILFIDSTHTVKIGGDVVFEILEILPQLKPGVIIHFHDIFLPSHYPKNHVLKGYYFWTEQYLLQAFLTFNPNFEVLLAASYMHLFHSRKLQSAFPSYDKNIRWPASFWIKKIK